MKLRTTVAAVGLAGALALGGAAPALAQEAPPDLPPRACAAARDTLQDLKALNRRVNREVRRLEAAIARAEAAGREGLAARLQAQLDRIEARQDGIQARIEALRARLADRCTPDTAPAS
jgi:phage host-nuclease inhibitor protein Gam